MYAKATTVQVSRLRIFYGLWFNKKISYGLWLLVKFFMVYGLADPPKTPLLVNI